MPEPPGGDNWHQSTEKRGPRTGPFLDKKEIIKTKVFILSKDILSKGSQPNQWVMLWYF